MPAKKISVRPPNAKNTGKSSNGKYMDDHPELQTGYWKNQVMTYDSALAVERNEIDYMLQSLQSDISDGKTVRQLGFLSLSNCRMSLLSWLSIS